MKFFYVRLPFTYLLSFLCFPVLQSQTPRFAKYEVMNTGAAVYFPAEPVFELSYSEDESEVYTAEITQGENSYGTIIVNFAEELGENSGEWESLLFSYMEFLNKSAFELVSVVDPGYGHTMESHPEAKGILEFGEDANGLRYVIKGWIDKNMLAVMFVYSVEEMNINLRNLFLDGFRFPLGK